MRHGVPFLLAMAFSVHAADAQHLHPRLKSGQVRFEHVAVLPVKVDVVRSGVKGGESMIAESETVALGVQSIVSKLLHQYGFTVLEDPISSRAPAADNGADERRAAVARLQSRFDTIAPQLRAKPKDVTKGRFTLGDEISGLLADRVEALVFVRGNGAVMTKGKSFLQGGLLGMAVLPKGHLQCDVVIVDARSGDVLFFARTTGQGDIVKAAGQPIEKPLSKSLKKVALRS